MDEEREAGAGDPPSRAAAADKSGEGAPPPHCVRSPSPTELGADRKRPKRVAALERTGSARRSVYVPLKRRARRFLEALAETGNATLACETAGIGRDRIYRHRRENAGFAASWQAALAAFRERADQGEGIDLEALGRAGMTVRRGRGGQVQIAAAHPRAWTKRDEQVFFSYYRESGNVSAAARAAGFSAKAAWDRAAGRADFARRLAEAKAEATERLDFYLVEEGTNLLRGADGGKPDPQLAMWLLKRADQEKVGTLKRGAAVGRPRSLDEVRDSILEKLSSIERHRAEGRREEGWTQTPEGHWIPPGYGPVADQAGADEAG